MIAGLRPLRSGTVSYPVPTSRETRASSIRIVFKTKGQHRSTAGESEYTLGVGLGSGSGIRKPIQIRYHCFVIIYGKGLSASDWITLLAFAFVGRW